MVVAGIAAIENVERIAAAEFGVAVLVGETGGNLGGYPVKEADGNRINVDIGIFAGPVAEIFGVLPHAADLAVNLVGKIVCGIDARIVFVVADEGVVLNGGSGVLESWSNEKFASILRTCSVYEAVAATCERLELNSLCWA